MLKQLFDHAINELQVIGHMIGRFNFSCELTEMSASSNGVMCLSFQKAEQQIPNDHNKSDLKLIH